MQCVKILDTVREYLGVVIFKAYEWEFIYCTQFSYYAEQGAKIFSTAYEFQQILFLLDVDAKNLTYFKRFQWQQRGSNVQFKMAGNEAVWQQRF